MENKINTFCQNNNETDNADRQTGFHQRFWSAERQTGPVFFVGLSMTMVGINLDSPTLKYIGIGIMLLQLAFIVKTGVGANDEQDSDTDQPRLD